MTSDTVQLKTLGVHHSADLQEACSLFMSDLGEWVHASMGRFPDGPEAIDNHDQGTFTISWEPWIRSRGDDAALAFMAGLRDAVKRRYTAERKWRHGYWCMHEAHHGTEHFELFLGTLWRLRTDDHETVGQFLDAAEHFGNWSPDVSDWFNWDTGLYRSTHFGADGVLITPGSDINLPDHIRCANISLLAWWMTQESRYLELSQLYAGKWAEAICAGDVLPVGLAATGPVYGLSPEQREAYGRFASQVSGLTTAVDRAENFLASGAIETFLRLERACGKPVFREAAGRLLDALCNALGDPDAGPAAAAMRNWRRTTGDERYDGRLRDAVRSMSPASIEQLAIEAQPPVVRPRPSGVGKRSDLPTWYEDGRERCCDPIALAVVAELDRDRDLARDAVDLARAYFRLATAVYADGMHHGCSARSVSAIARGHGRCNGAGMVTAVLAPVMETFMVRVD